MFWNQRKIFLALFFLTLLASPLAAMAQDPTGESGSGSMLVQLREVIAPSAPSDPDVRDRLVNTASESGSQESSEGEGASNAQGDHVGFVEVRTLEPGFEAAKNSLSATYSNFLHREPLGFDLGLINLLVSDGQKLVTAATDRIQDPGKINPWALVSIALSLLVFVLFLVLLRLLERHSVRASYRIQARVHFDISAPLTSLSRKAILVLGRVAPFPLLILLSFFPIRATFGDRGWTLFLTSALIIALIFRGLRTALHVGIRLNPPPESKRKDWGKIERFLWTGLRIFLAFSLLLAALEHFPFHQDLQSFVLFIYKVILALLPTYLFLVRETLFDVFPSKHTSNFLTSIRSGLRANFAILLTLTVVLLLFNAAGYEYAARFLLTRSYVLLVAVILWVGLLNTVRDAVHRREEEAQESGESASPMFSSLHTWLATLGTIVIIFLGLRFVGLYDPIVAILRVPFLAVGRIEISAFNLVKVGLIITTTVLSIRLLKSMMNALVYPALKVEVGTAYAVNTLINYALIVTGLIMSLLALGVHLSALLVVFASLGVGIGFGLQNITENLISGFILLFGRAVRKGDYITVNELYGRVEAVGARSVVMRTPDNYSMLIPSKEIVSGRIINWTFHDSIVRIHIPIGVSYDANPGKVRDILLESAKKHPDILQEPKPDVWITEFGDHAIVLELLVYFDCRTTTERALKGKFNFILWEDLKEAGVEIPFPQRDLHLRSVDESISFPTFRGPSPESHTQTDKGSTPDPPKNERSGSS